MTKTEAIKTAATLVDLDGRGTSWRIWGPYRCSEPRGASTESHASSYGQALRIRTGWRARVALALMGKLNDDTSGAVEDVLYDWRERPRDVSSILNEALRCWREAE